MLTKVKDTLPLGKQSNVVNRILCSCGQVYIGEIRQRLETRLKEHRDACEKGMMEKSAVAEHALENHYSIQETMVLDHGRLLVKEALLLLRWRTGSPWLLDCCDEEAGREEQSSLIFDRVSSVVHFRPDND